MDEDRPGKKVMTDAATDDGDNGRKSKLLIVYDTEEEFLDKCIECHSLKLPSAFSKKIVCSSLGEN